MTRSSRIHSKRAVRLSPVHGVCRAAVLGHRREAQLLEALANGPRTVPELVAELYRGLPEPLLRFAQLQVLAGLQKLSNEGHVRSSTTKGEGWEPTGR